MCLPLDSSERSIETSEGRKRNSRVSLTTTTSEGWVARGQPAYIETKSSQCVTMRLCFSSQTEHHRRACVLCVLVASASSQAQLYSRFPLLVLPVFCFRLRWDTNDNNVCLSLGPTGRNRAQAITNLWRVAPVACNGVSGSGERGSLHALTCRVGGLIQAWAFILDIRL
jgi:hypothetical protein